MEISNQFSKHTNGRELLLELYAQLDQEKNYTKQILIQNSINNIIAQNFLSYITGTGNETMV